MELTILMPCLNEERTVKICINKALESLRKNNIDGEVLIADNGSTDGSLKIIASTAARVVNVEKKGYGSAIRFGIKAAKGRYVIMCDSDDSYDLENIMPFVLKLREGYDLVMGTRYGGIEKGAMSFSHYWGVKFLTGLGNILYGTRLEDYHCGLRGFNREKINRLDLECPGMEFASEIIIKCQKKGYRIAEVKTRLFKDGRGKPSHLNTIKDGLRHVRCLLKYR